MLTDMLNEINDWLLDQNYYQGIRLLLKYQPDHEVVTRLQGDPTPTKRQQLLAAMKDLQGAFKVQRGTVATVAKAIQNSQPINVVETMQQLQQDLTSQSSDPDAWPAEVVEAWKQRRALANERDKLANQLTKAPDQAARRDLYQQIKACHMNIQPLTDLIEHYNRTGSLPGTGPKVRPRGPGSVEIRDDLDESEKEQLLADLRNARARRSKAKAKLKALETDDDLDPEMKAIQVRKYELKRDQADNECGAIEVKLYGN